MQDKRDVKKKEKEGSSEGEILAEKEDEPAKTKPTQNKWGDIC